MLADLALAIKRRRRAIDRIRFHQHLADIGERLTVSRLDFVELFDFTELGQQVGNVIHNLGIANANLLRVPLTYNFDEKLLQRMRIRNHFLRPPNAATIADFHYSCASFYPSSVRNASNFCKARILLSLLA